MARSSAVLLASAITVMVGCAACSKIPQTAREALDEADHFELLSIDPDGRQEKAQDDFHGWKVLGRTPIKDAGTRERLVAALKQGVGESDGTVAKCFNPRHGIRASQGGKAVDLVICFECLQVHVYTGAERSGEFLTTASPQPVFDQVLREAGLPLSGADR